MERLICVAPSARLPDEAALTENQIQKALFSHFALRRSEGVFEFHPKNGSRDMADRKAGIHLGLGVRQGIPDVIVSKTVRYLKGSYCRIFALELKRESRRNKKLTPHERTQAACRAEMEARGWTTAVAFGLDDAIAQCERWGLLKVSHRDG